MLKKYRRLTHQAIATLGHPLSSPAAERGACNRIKDNWIKEQRKNLLNPLCAEAFPCEASAG